MTGKLFGVGIGPGDSELLTLKAVRVIKEADIIAVPGSKKEDTVAYNIALGAVPELSEKEVMEIEWPMTKNMETLNKVYDAASQRICMLLNEGKKVAFLTLGDPCIYSTYLYIHRKVTEAGYDTELVNGIPSFCAVAARLNMGLVERAEQLHVIPNLDNIEDNLQLPGTKVLMKSGKRVAGFKEAFENFDGSFSMIENCGMEGERIFNSPEDIPQDMGYYATMVLKEK